MKNIDPTTAALIDCLNRISEAHGKIAEKFNKGVMIPEPEARKEEAERIAAQLEELNSKLF
jgi:hypothetical protein